MSIKSLFGKSSGKILPSTDSENIGKVLESDKLLDSLKVEKDKFIPDVDFSNPKSFAKFGSASKYYEDAIRLIYKTYPYDGSKNEKTEWQNSASLLTNYVLNELYPTNTGYINLGLNYGNIVSSTSSYTLTDKPEYILIKGGPNTYSETDTAKSLFGKSNYYNDAYKRASNLNLDGDSGVTVEFYLRKNDTSGSSKQCVFDLWNSSSLTSSEYGRFKIETHPGIVGEENKFYISFNSGSFGATEVELSASSFIDQSWHHFGIAAINTGSEVLFQLFQDGVLTSEAITGSSVSQVEGPMMATIGSLITEEYAGGPSLGWGKLSGSIDEFRFWKIKRIDKEISRYYFTEIYGGTNTDDANTDLGVYFKFNEGIFDTGSINNYDKNIIDYSGRISNATWTGYSLGARETGSALIESGFTQEEPADPIIYQNHPQVLALIDSLEKKTISYDQLNNSSIYNSYASWILEEDEKNGSTLSELTQISSEFFDELYFYIQSLPGLKDHTYKNKNPLPFAKRLVESHGLSTVELFSDSTALEIFLSRNEKDVFEQKIDHIKNTIYQNIYNNLLYIYRSKGTEKSIRNLLRCFGVDTELVKLNLYANDQKFIFEDRYEFTSQKRKYIDFNDPDRFEGTVYQITQSGDTNSSEFIKGDIDSRYFGNTLETEIIFPRKFKTNEDFYFETSFLTSSLFGMHEPDITTDKFTWTSPDRANLQVFSVRPEKESDDVYFMLSSSYLNVVLTSSLFKDVYTDQKWLFSYRIRHENYPLAGGVLGASTGNYVVEFGGLNTTMDILQNSFSVSGTVDLTTAEQYFTSPKKIYLGAHHENFTGSTVDGLDGQEQLSDVQIGAARFWLNYLPDTVLDMHAKDMTSHGPEYYQKNVENYLDVSAQGLTVPQADSLILHWNFELVTGSDNGAGTLVLNLNDAGFNIVDMSSGSQQQLTDYPVLSEIGRQNHPARADFFLRNNTDVVSTEYIPNARRRLPEILNNDDLVNILQRDDETYIRDQTPVNHYFSVEKSMYQNISEEMLRWMGTITQFNNLIGKPTDRYEASYRDLNFLRTIFFKNVGNTPDFEKFVDFYKWIDESVARIIMELIPASLSTTTVASNVVESHILERNKYRHKLPTIEFKGKEPVAAIRTINELKYNWKFGHAPIPLQENNNCLWWKEREEKETDREKIFAALKSTYERNFTTVYDLNIDAVVIINKSPKEYDIIKTITKFGSGEYLEIDIPLAVPDDIDCNDDNK
jgi:hypothetical protein